MSTVGDASPAAGGSRRLLRCLCAALASLAPRLARSAEGGDGGSPAADASSLHYQATVATQWHPSFSARTSGRNSLQPEADSATSVVMDLFAGLRPWRGAELHVQPELSGGRGLSSTLGVAAFPSGEVYRVGNPDLSVRWWSLRAGAFLEPHSRAERSPRRPGRRACRR